MSSKGDVSLGEAPRDSPRDAKPKNLLFLYARQHHGGDHNRRETPLFAASIERLALSKKYWRGPF
jgi:hypothetical protein